MIASHREKSLLHLLRERGDLSLSSVRLLEGFSAKWGCSHFEAILETNVLNERRLTECLAAIFDIPKVSNVDTVPVSQEVLALISFDQARKWLCLPVRYLNENKGKLEVIVADPSRQDRLTQLSDNLKVELSLAIAEASDLAETICHVYSVWHQLPAAVGHETV